MTTRGRWALVAVLSLGGVLAATGPATAAPGGVAASAAGTDGPCAPGTGVSVVVDFNSLQPGTAAQARCAPGSPTTGFDALNKADIKFEAAGSGYLCRIAGLPAGGPCRPANAYWSYWHLNPGGSWTYSDEGAASFKPAVGSLEGWSFFDGTSCARPPRYGPQPPPCADPTTTTTHATTTTTSKPTTTPSTNGGGGETTTTIKGSPAAPPTSARPNAGGGGAPTTAGVLGAGSSSNGSQGATPATTGGVGDPTATASAAEPNGSSSTALPKGGDGRSASGTVDLTKGASGAGSGSPVGALAGAGAIAVIGAGAAITAQRRRRSSVVTPLGLPVEPPLDPPEPPV